MRLTNRVTLTVRGAASGKAEPASKPLRGIDWNGHYPDDAPTRWSKILGWFWKPRHYSAVVLCVCAGVWFMAFAVQGGFAR